jgi:hypothetical protein
MSKQGGKAPKTRRSGADTFVVKLMRPIFQTAVVLIEASDEAQAVKRAFRMARRLPEDDWEGDFDRRNYTVDLQHVLNATKAIEERGLSPSVDSEVSLAAELAASDDVQYVVLKADVDSGEGETHAQPWLRRCSDFLLADFARDWREQLDPVERQGIEGYRGMWGAGWRPNPSERRENVVPFRKPDNQDDDSEDEPA